jgi:heme-degrading monooxygenase HmoA
MVVVLFSTRGRDGVDVDDHSRTSGRMRELVAQVPGFISYNTYEDQSGEGVAIARFESHAALDAWRKNLEHVEAQRKGREEYYDEYWVQVCDSVRDYRFSPRERYTTDLKSMFAARSTIRPTLAL